VDRSGAPPGLVELHRGRLRLTGYGPAIRWRQSARAVTVDGRPVRTVGPGDDFGVAVLTKVGVLSAPLTLRGIG
jgi:hypothetical protein